MNDKILNKEKELKKLNEEIITNYGENYNWLAAILLPLMNDNQYVEITFKDEKLKRVMQKYKNFMGNK